MNIHTYIITTVLLAFCVPLHAERYPLPAENESMIGQMAIISAKESDTFLAIARRFGIGFQEIVIANPTVDPWLPGEGTQIIIPSQYILPDVERDGLVLNLAEMRVYYYPKTPDGKSKYVHTYPISIGQEGWDTPHTQTKIIGKSKDPTWYPPKSIRKEHEEKGDPLPTSVPPGPDNPLGKYALRLGLSGYLIHGTNEPRGIGMKVTHGCIRLHPDDIEDLFNRIPLNTPVTIVNQPYKIAWYKDRLYAEMHPNEGDETATNSRYLTEFVRTIIEATESEKDYKVDWELANNMARNNTGVPIIVGSKP